MWKSKAQQKWGHSKVGLKALGGKEKVKEWDHSTDFKKLPAKRRPGLKHVRLK